ncbi:MAG: DEAD/DEAH box helicase [Bacteroidetes bacterium]|nr:DEAD/DEAH box helicase [Bacteroidota bacterium]
MSNFSSLGLAEPILRALKNAGYTTPTPIQAEAIPAALEGQNVLGIAQTGTGKTAAFTLPLLEHMMSLRGRPQRSAPRALVLTPTRELANQIAESLKTYGSQTRVSHVMVYGGVSQFPQVKALKRGVDVVVATPGRLLDLINQGHLSLDAVSMLVLDEADRMLDMGFIGDIREVCSQMPDNRQTLFFSATMPKAIQSLVDEIMPEHETVNIAPGEPTVDRITQRMLFVARENKEPLIQKLFESEDAKRVIVFTKTKMAAEKLSKRLNKQGVSSDAIHGDKSQAQRQRALNGFKKGKVRSLIATDVAARGIDVDDITHVINYDLPIEPEAYVHRIGRTARAGQSGQALSFCAADEINLLQAIQRFTKQEVAVLTDHPFHDEAIAERASRPPRSGHSGKPGGGSSSRRGKPHFKSGGKPGFKGKGSPKGSFSAKGKPSSGNGSFKKDAVSRDEKPSRKQTSSRSESFSRDETTPRKSHKTTFSKAGPSRPKEHGASRSESGLGGNTPPRAKGTRKRIYR